MRILPKHPLFLMLCLLVILGAFTGAAGAAIITVDDDGLADYDNISDAIANANTGDTILVAAGTYEEQVIVNVQVSIVGAGVNQTIVMPSISNAGTGSGSQVATTTWVFRIQANNVIITGLTVNGNNPNLSAGIDARGGIITDYSTGTYSGLQVSNCMVTNVSFRGIYAAAGGTAHQFQSNNVTNVNAHPLDSAGIFFYGAEGNAILNTVENCSIGIGFHQGGGGTIQNNVLRNCELGALANSSVTPVNVEDNVITDCDQGVQSIAVDTTVSVLTNIITGCLTGLTFFGMGANTNVVAGNVIDCQNISNSNGVFASTDVSPWGYGNLNLTLTNNDIMYSEYGIVLSEDVGNNSYALNCTISGGATLYNRFIGNLSFNLYLQDCNDDVDATYNVWGAVTPSVIEAAIWHQFDDLSLGLVTYTNTINLYITVDDDGTGDFYTINPAVQNLVPGGTILVKPGSYVQDVVIDRSCIIQGSGTDSDPLVGTVLSGASVDAALVVVSVTGSDVTIDNLRIDGTQPTYARARHCVYGNGISNLKVTDCVMGTARSAIHYENSTAGVFLRNEIFDFGLNVNTGGGIFVQNATATVGTFGSGNYLHDGVASGVILNGGSSGTVTGNRAANCGVGYLAYAVGGAATFDRNEARDCLQGFQGFGNLAPVTYTENVTMDCPTGFTLFGLGGQLHTYTDNYIRSRTSPAGSAGFYFTTTSPLGDSDLNAVCRGNVISGGTNCIQLYESATSMSYQMNVDLDGSTNPNWITGGTSQALRLTGCNDNIDASDNYFASTNATTVEGMILHQVDNPALGLVDFSGLLAPGPDIRRRGQIVDLQYLSLLTTGAPGDSVLLIWGVVPANINTRYGILRISPFIVVTGYPTQSQGLGILEFVVPVHTPHAGVTHYFQALVGNNPNNFLTNRAQATTPPLPE
ncbi:MAG: right-handed parallel beta-helix repeat-containing protein [Planctomycetota bacterium]